MLFISEVFFEVFFFVATYHTTFLFSAKELYSIPTSGSIHKKSPAMNYFRIELPLYYRRRWCVLLSCSEWEGVGPHRYNY